jgi:hypothetical protein
MTRRFQFSLRTLLVVVVLGPAFFFGGIHFERERRRRAMDAWRAVIEKTARELEIQKSRARTHTSDDALPAE